MQDNQIWWPSFCLASLYSLLPYALVPLQPMLPSGSSAVVWVQNMVTEIQQQAFGAREPVQSELQVSWNQCRQGTSH